MSTRVLTPGLRLAAWRKTRPVGAAALCASRHFSSTRALDLRVTAMFSETGHQRLDEQLTRIQDTIIMPAYLPAKQRKMVFNPRFASQLQKDPLSIEIDGIDYRFRALDRFKDVPNSKNALTDALNLMAEAGNFKNLPTLLSGYRKAGIVINPHQKSKITRRVVEDGNVSAIVECAIHTDKTGYTITRMEDLLRMLLSLNQRIVASGWSLEEATRAVKTRNNIMELLERPEHNCKHSLRSDYKLQLRMPVMLLMMFSKVSFIKAKKEAGQDVSTDMKEVQQDIVRLKTLWDFCMAKVWEVWDIPDYIELAPDRYFDVKQKKVLRRRLRARNMRPRLDKHYKACLNSTAFALFCEEEFGRVQVH
ncbi:hypothetical protein CDD82_3248 [Ophiocordyceps australis]|uniref:Uncharacterized protein n=1 Tax=Ophiocordyceps australis TaxID=1399860 RepID=A0A2C5ZAJ7_9HYPO|nr:hypothetical protein CDD82_3248 [Ophiocordyceps australis]